MHKNIREDIREDKWVDLYVPATSPVDSDCESYVNLTVSVGEFAGIMLGVEEESSALVEMTVQQARCLRSKLDEVIDAAVRNGLS
jgi:hypothetical protein